MTTSETFDELFAAIGSFNGLKVTKNRQNDSVSNDARYADLEAVWRTIKSKAARQDLVIVQAPTFDGGAVQLLTRVFHQSSGQWLDHVCSIPSGWDAQQAGSAITYARRYALVSIFGLVPTDDDDGQRARMTPHHIVEQKRREAARLESERNAVVADVPHIIGQR